MYPKVNQVIFLLIPIYSPGFKALAFIGFEIFCWQDFIYIFQRAITQERGIILMGKIRVSYFFIRHPYMKFQKPSMHGSEVMLCIKKRSGRTDGHTNVLEAICPSNFEVWGIKIPRSKYSLRTVSNELLGVYTSFTEFQKMYEKSPGSATITNRSPSQTPRGRGNRQIQTSTNRTNVRKALRLALSSPGEVIAMLKGLKNTRTKWHKVRHKTNRLV